ncbi:hypothetical protein DAKH74_006550 [Maudiozyma humilis]|uniref:Zn(2)-C6 fungal-type domain-containing protein n=1 Tax=Maudiozyma humilis TaxID=51915 RepID=A0AAV5RR85_MAUHU|nr:hypothetical protein DAKH74_006550 [Kazachstania humilis]
MEPESLDNISMDSGYDYSSDNDPGRRNSASKRAPACAQCRRRKIGCDRLKPSCSSCLKFHKEKCLYPDVDPEAFNEYLMQPSPYPHMGRRPSNMDIYAQTAIAAGMNGMPTLADLEPYGSSNNNSTTSIPSIAPSATNKQSATFNVHPQQPAAAAAKNLQQGKMMQVIQPSTTPVTSSAPSSAGRTGSFSIAPNTTIPLQTMQTGPYMSAAQSMQQSHQQSKFRNSVKAENSHVMVKPHIQQQPIKIHKAQNTPVYEPPSIIPSNTSVEFVRTKATTTKRNHHGKHNAVIPKVSVSLEQIGAFNTWEHMMQLNKEMDRKSKTFTPRDELPVEFGVMKSSGKQKDIYLKEMQHLTERLMELQRQREASMPSNKVQKKHGKSARSALSQQSDSANGDSRTPSHSQTINSSQSTDILSIVNLHTRVSSFGKSELLIKDTPNSPFTINFLVNRDNFLTNYYSNLQTFIIMNYKNQLTQFKQKQFNEVNKRMGNAPEEKDLLRRLIEKLTKSLDDEDVVRPTLFMQYLGSVVNNTAGSFDVRNLRELIFGQFDKTYGTPGPANYLSEVAKFGTLLIILLYCVVINNVGSAPVIEVLKRKISYILDEVKSVTNRDVLIHNSSVLRLLTVRSFFHDMVEDFDELNDVDVDEEVYLVKWGGHRDDDESRDGNSGAALCYAVFRNYMNRHISKGALPSMLTFEELRESAEDQPFAAEAVSEIALWQAEVAILDQLESRGGTATGRPATSIRKLQEQLTELTEVYERVFKENVETQLNAVSKRVAFQTYHKMSLLLHYYIALQHEVVRAGGPFSREVSLVLRHAAALVELPHATHESRCLFAKTDLVVLELVSEILFSLGLRCKTAGAANAASEENPAGTASTANSGASVLQGRIARTLSKLSHTLTHAESRDARHNYTAGLSARLTLKLANYVSWLQLRRATELPHLPNAAAHLDSAETAALSAALHELSEALLREGAGAAEGEEESEAAAQWPAEYRRSLETLRTRATTAGNLYGLTGATFSALFEAAFQK